MNTTPGPRPPTSAAVFTVDSHGITARQGATLVYEVPCEILPALGLPDRDTLTDAQQRGAKCAWCAITLTADTVIDLGEQYEDGVWFPRACRDCVPGRARRALKTHPGMCEQCSLDSANPCEIETVLWQLIGEGR